jgi:hypothetical protein
VQAGDDPYSSWAPKEFDAVSEVAPQFAAQPLPVFDAAQAQEQQQHAQHGQEGAQEAEEPAPGTEASLAQSGSLGREGAREGAVGASDLPGTSAGPVTDALMASTETPAAESGFAYDSASGGSTRNNGTVNFNWCIQPENVLNYRSA